MGREVRRVPGDWQHPKKDDNEYIPLFDGKDFATLLAAWDSGAEKWAEGLRDDHKGGWKPVETENLNISYEDLDGARPQAEDFMPQWTESEATHYAMYETTTEGTPISPNFETAEDLAKWLTNTKASAFGGLTATYEQWLRVCHGGYAPSAVMASGILRPGVAL